MPRDLEPPELQQLVDFAERPRVADWSLRAALVRYAQGQPQRVGDLMEQVRRVEAALQAHRKVFEADGPALWTAVTEGRAPVDADQAPAVDLLGLVVALDRVGDALATWAVDRVGDPPGAQVDEVTAALATGLDELGVPRESREAPPRGRGGRGGRGV